VLFGTRHLEATERHEGMVAAIAVESIVKLLAFLAAGIFVTFVLYDGFGDLFGRAAQLERTAPLMKFGRCGGRIVDLAWCCWSMMAILFLPRQFQVSVVENVNEGMSPRRSGSFRPTCWPSTSSCCRSRWPA